MGLFFFPTDILDYIFKKKEEEEEIPPDRLANVIITYCSCQSQCLLMNYFSLKVFEYFL